jgi:hypothetical protein
MSQYSNEDDFDDYRDEVSIPPTEKYDSGDQLKEIKHKVKGKGTWNNRLRGLNKALRGKLKEFNDLLEHEIEKVYVKRLNPRKQYEQIPDVSHLNQVADKELENAKKQYEI